MAVQRLGDGEPGAAQEPGALRGLAVVQFRAQQPVDGLELPWRGPGQQVVDGGLGDEQGAGPRPQPVDVRALLVPLAHALSSLPANARSYPRRVDGLVVGDGLGPGGVSGRGQAYAGAVDAAGGLEDLGHRRHRVRPSALAFGPRWACATPRRGPRAPARRAIRAAGREAPPGPGCWARPRACRHGSPICRDGPLAAGGVVAVGARMRRDAGPGGIEQLDLERAQPDDQLAPRMLGAGRVPVPALDGDDPVLVGLHAFPRGHVEACLRQRQQCFAVPARTGPSRDLPCGSGPCRPARGTARAAWR